MDLSSADQYAGLHRFVRLRGDRDCLVTYTIRETRPVSCGLYYPTLRTWLPLPLISNRVLLLAERSAKDGVAG